MTIKHLHNHTDEELLDWAKAALEQDLLYWTSETYIRRMETTTYDRESCDDFLNRRCGVYAAELARRRLGLTDEKQA